MVDGENMTSLSGLLIEEVEWVWSWKKMRLLLNTLSWRCLVICYRTYGQMDVWFGAQQ